MKKILSIALIAALFVASAFAGFGDAYAALDLGFNLDSKAYGFTNSKTIEYSMSYEIGADAAEKAGEGDLRAAIAAEFAAGIVVEDDAIAFDDVTLKITKADILYKDAVRVGILGAGTSKTYATAYYPVDESKSVSSSNPLVSKIGGLTGVNGFNFTAYGVDGEFGLTGDAAAETYKVLAHAATTVNAGDVAVNVAAGTLLSDAGNSVVAAAKAAFANDQFSADAAVDFKYASDKAAVEVGANAKYAPVTVNVYFVTEDSFETTKLDAKVSGAIALDPVTLTAYADARDLTVDARELKLGLNAVGTVDAFELEGDVKASVLVAKTITAYAKATYKADMFTAAAKFTVGMSYASDFAVTKLAPEVTVSSTKLIDGATITLGWAGADFKADANGKINAQVKISL